MNTFKYGTIAIPTPDIKVIESTAVYDPSDTTVMYTKTILRVTGTIQFDDSLSMAQNAVFFRKSLLVPRQALLVLFGGSASSPTPENTMFNIPANGDHVGGPKPRKCELTEIVGSNFAFVAFEIEISVQEACDAPSNIISHSYTVSHSLDNRFYTTRTIRGSFRVRQSATDNNPDVLRGLIVPNLPNGFQRTAMDFTVSADGLELAYAITDKEVFRVPPMSGVEWRGTFEQVSSNYVWHNHISIEIKGHKFQDQLSMMNDIFTVASSRIDFSSEFLMHSSITEGLNDNSVRFDCITMTNAAPANGPDGAGTIPANTRIFTDIGLGNNNSATTLGPYGTAIIAAAKKTFYVACGKGENPTINFVQLSANNGSVGSVAGSDGTSPAAGISPGSSSQSSDQTGKFPYTHFEQTIEYNQNNGVVVLPSTYASVAGNTYQLHNPYMTVTQEGSAMRVGKPPVVPVPQTVFPGTLKTNKVKMLSPTLMADKKTFQFAAVWKYEILVPFTSSDFISKGVPGGNGPIIVTTTLSEGSVQYAPPSNLATTSDPKNANNQLGVNAPINVPALGGI